MKKNLGKYLYIITFGITIIALCIWLYFIFNMEFSSNDQFKNGVTLLLYYAAFIIVTVTDLAFFLVFIPAIYFIVKSIHYKKATLQNISEEELQQHKKQYTKAKLYLIPGAIYLVIIGGCILTYYGYYHYSHYKYQQKKLAHSQKVKETILTKNSNQMYDMIIDRKTNDYDQLKLVEGLDNTNSENELKTIITTRKINTATKRRAITKLKNYKTPDTAMFLITNSRDINKYMGNDEYVINELNNNYSEIINDDSFKTDLEQLKMSDKIKCLEILKQLEYDNIHEVCVEAFNQSFMPNLYAGYKCLTDMNDTRAPILFNYSLPADMDMLNTQDRNKMIRFLTELGNKNEDEKEINKYLTQLSISPNHASSLKKLASLYEKKGDYDNALKYYNLYFNIYPKNKNYIKACLYRKKGDYQKALEACKQIDEKNDKEYIELGDIYFALGQYENALDSYKEASLLYDQKPSRKSKKGGFNYFPIAKCYYYLKDYDNADKYIKLSLGSSAEFYYYKGSISQAKGDNITAKYFFTKAEKKFIPENNQELKAKIEDKLRQLQHISSKNSLNPEINNTL